MAEERGLEFYKEIGKKGGESRGNKSRTVNQKEHLEGQKVTL